MALHDALLEVQKEAQTLDLTPEATGQVQSRNYKYLTIGKLHAAVLPLLQKNGLLWVCYPEAEGLAYTLSTTNDEAIIAGIVPYYGVTTMQTLGSAITYARRYALLAVLGLTPDEDDDGAAASEKKSEAPQAERSAVPQIPVDRAKKILEAAQAADLADGLELKPGLAAKLADVGVETGKLGHLNVDQAEAVEAFIEAEKGKAS